MPTVLLILLALVACNRDRIETPAGAANETVLTDTSTTPPPADTGTTTMATTTTTATPNTNTAPPSDAAPAPTAQIAEGRATYEAKCAGCHGLDGKKVAGPVTLASRETQSKPDADLVRAIRDSGPHRGLTESDPQAAAVVAYLKALK